MKNQRDSSSGLLIKNIDSLISCDGNDHIFHDHDLLICDGIIRRIAPSIEEAHLKENGIADVKIIDGSHMWVYPGLINTHHHLYQIFSRNLPQVQNLELFDWLKYLYEIWQNLNEKSVYLSTLTGLSELALTGTTTCFDHHYVFPKDAGDLAGTQFEAAEKLGMRMVVSRGSMDLSVKDGGLPPDCVVQSVHEILKDSIRIIDSFHDPSRGSMRNVVLAPCSPFSVSADLLRESAVLARDKKVRLHTHLCETLDEEKYMLESRGVRPLEYMESLGWVGPDVWYAHGIHFNDDELKLLADTGTGVAHCPVSNMKLSSGVARIPEMLKLGVKVGLAVDGSASNDGSSLLEEMRVCYLLHRLISSKKAPSGYDILKIATRGSASLLGREDIGSLEEGKCADLFMIDSRRPELTATHESPEDVLGVVGLKGNVDMTIINGQVIVKDQRITTLDQEDLRDKAQAEWKNYLNI